MLLSFLYFLLPLSCFAANFIREFNRGRFLKYLLIIMLSLFYCGGYMTGNDWPGYERYYNRIADGKEVSLDAGYVWLNSMFAELDIPFWDFFTIMRFFCFFSLIALLSCCSSNFWLCLGLLAGKDLIVFFIENMMRNSLSMAVFWVSCIICLRLRRIGFLFLFIPLAVLFHKSALLLLPFLCLSFLLSKLPIRYSLVLFLTIWMIFASQTFMLETFLGFGYLFAETKWSEYFDSAEEKTVAGVGLSFTSLLKLIVGVLLICNRDRIFACNKNILPIFYFALVWILSNRLATSIPILGRVSNFLLPFYYITVVFYFKNVSKTHFSKVVLFVFIIYNFATIYPTITSSHKYVPYSNYLIYLMRGDELSLNYRSRYNIENSPFKVDEYKKPQSILFKVFE